MEKRALARSAIFGKMAAALTTFFCCWQTFLPCSTSQRHEEGRTEHFLGKFSLLESSYFERIEEFGENLSAQPAGTPSSAAFVLNFFDQKFFEFSSKFFKQIKQESDKNPW